MPKLEIHAPAKAKTDIEIVESNVNALENQIKNLQQSISDLQSSMQETKTVKYFDFKFFSELQVETENNTTVTIQNVYAYIINDEICNFSKLLNDIEDSIANNELTAVKLINNQNINIYYFSAKSVVAATSVHVGQSLTNKEYTFGDLCIVNDNSESMTSRTRDFTIGSETYKLVNNTNIIKVPNDNPLIEPQNPDILPTNGD